MENQRSAFTNTYATKRNKLHALDFRYAVRVSVCLLKPIGAWPLADDKTSRLNIVLHKALMTIATLILFFIIVPWIVTIIIQKWDIMMILRTMCPLLFTTTTTARYLLLLWHQDQLKSCVNRVADDWRYVIAEDRKIMLEYARLGRTLGIVSVTFMFSCGILYYTQPLTLSTIDENNVTIRVHPVPCEFLVFDAKISPAYEIVYFFQALSGTIVYSTYSGGCSLMANFVTHVCGQCDILISMFEEAVDGGEHNSGSIDERIATAVNQHLRLLNLESRFYTDCSNIPDPYKYVLRFPRLVSGISGLFTEICLVEFINSSCNICLIGYYIVTDLNNNASFVQISMFGFAFMSIIFNVFLFCYIGDLLMESCQKVGNACYSIEWYRMPPKKAIELIMPITMSRYPTILTAGKMIAMNLTTFSNILKTSMAYFNLIRQFTSRDDMRA